MTVILNPDSSEQLAYGIDFLKNSIPVALPTETVYGLGAKALSTKALAKIFELKARPHFDPLIVHILNAEWLKDLVLDIPEPYLDLMKSFWPGPMTLLFRKKDCIPDLCTSGLKEVAIRCPSHPVFQNVLERLKEPLAAPSANRFGKISPTSAEAVCDELGPFGLEAVFEGGPCYFGVESTVLRFNSESKVLEVLRPGSLSLETIQTKCDIPVVQMTPLPLNVLSPGQLESHYSPNSPSEILMDSDSQQIPKNAPQSALLSVFPLQTKAIEKNFAKSLCLSEKSSDKEAAQNLFHSLRKLDQQKFEKIYFVLGPEKGLGLAVNDRLRRAAAKRN